MITPISEKRVFEGGVSPAKYPSATTCYTKGNQTCELLIPQFPLLLQRVVTQDLGTAKGTDFDFSAGVSRPTHCNARSYYTKGNYFFTHFLDVPSKWGVSPLKHHIATPCSAKGNYEGTSIY